MLSFGIKTHSKSKVYTTRNQIAIHPSRPLGTLTNWTNAPPSSNFEINRIKPSLTSNSLFLILTFFPISSSSWSWPEGRDWPGGTGEWLVDVGSGASSFERDLEVCARRSLFIVWSWVSVWAWARSASAIEVRRNWTWNTKSNDSRKGRMKYDQEAGPESSKRWDGWRSLFPFPIQSNIISTSPPPWNHRDEEQERKNERGTPIQRETKAERRGTYLLIL